MSSQSPSTSALTGQLKIQATGNTFSTKTKIVLTGHQKAQAMSSRSLQKNSEFQDS